MAKQKTIPTLLGVIIIMVVAVVLFGGVFAWEYYLNSKQPELQTQTPSSQVYKNTKYGFQITLPADWKGYSVVEQTWQGWAIDGSNKKYSGPEIIIKNPKTTATQTYQDIPVMIFTLEQWGPEPSPGSPGMDNNPAGFAVNAAPVGPSEIGKNSKYVFATPPRWYGFTDAIGWQEAVDAVKTFKSF